MSIYYTSANNPFKLTRKQIITPICTRGYTGAVVIGLVLKKMYGANYDHNVRNCFGITADPKFVFDEQHLAPEDDTKIIVKTDVSLYANANDEFEKVFGFKRNPDLHNWQTFIMIGMGVNEIKGPNPEYASAVRAVVWDFPTNLTRVFILMTMDQKEINAAVKNIGPSDILVVFESYNLVAYPTNGTAPFSVQAYNALIHKVQEYFCVAND